MNLDEVQRKHSRAMQRMEETMERLTDEIQIGPFAALKDKAEAVPSAFSTYDCFYAHAIAVTRLKQYEDAMPLERAQELSRAEKDGRLVVLPCKVGDVVWTNFSMSGWYFRGKDKPYSARVVFIGLNNSDAMGRGLINVVYGKHDYMTQFPLSDIGKTAFLTREEAEAALKKREADNEAVR